MCLIRRKSNRNVKEDPRRIKDVGRISVGGASISMDLSMQTMLVRIVHAGGRVELYQNAVPASHMMRKYPGICVARPDVFKNPHTSLLRAEEKLLPGHKYFLIPSTTAQKLTNRHARKLKVKESAENKGVKSDGNCISDADEDSLEESISRCSAKDYYVSREKWSKSLKKQSGRGKKKPFVPPIPKVKSSRGSGWEPSLTSVQELSP